MRETASRPRSALRSLCAHGEEAKDVTLHSTNHRRHWTPEADRALFLALGDMLSPHAVAARLGRTPSAIQRRHRELGGDLRARRARAEGVSFADLRRGLGVRDSTVRGWLARGWLACREIRAGSVVYRSFSVDAICDFLEERGALLRLRPSAEWAAIVRDCRADLERRLISRPHLERAIRYHNFDYLQRRFGFPRAALRLGVRNGGDYYERAAVLTWLDGHPEYCYAGIREAVAWRG